jgi:hypothetical protein
MRSCGGLDTKRAKRTPAPGIAMKIAADKALHHEVPPEQHVSGEKAGVGGILVIRGRRSVGEIGTSRKRALPLGNRRGRLVRLWERDPHEPVWDAAPEKTAGMSHDLEALRDGKAMSLGGGTEEDRVRAKTHAVQVLCTEAGILSNEQIVRRALSSSRTPAALAPRALVEEGR